MPVKTRKKLIEVALPLKEINEASVREGFIYRGNPSAIHKWWAQRPLATVRAVIFSQMVDDPSAVPEVFPTEEAQARERERLFGIIKEMVKWENTTNEAVMQKARDEIWKSWRRACADNASYPDAKDLFNSERLPAFRDPFAGGGSLPLEAQRLGLEAYASDLNPVAVLICKAMIEIPPKFAGRPPVNPESQAERARGAKWHGKGAQGLVDDVRYYGKWMRDEAEKRIGHLYPKIEVTPAMAAGRSDLASCVGKKLTVIAWLWARTVKSPNPAFANVAVPLASTFMLSTKPGKEAYVEPVIENGGYRFTVKIGNPIAPARRFGTSAGKQQAFLCLMSGAPITYDYIRGEGKAGRLGARLMALVVEGSRGRVYLPPTSEQEQYALGVKPKWWPETRLPEKALGFRIQEYGMVHFSDLFTGRQLAALTTFTDLVAEVRERIYHDALSAHFSNDTNPVRSGGRGAKAYGEAVSTYLAFARDKAAEYSCTIVPWYPRENRPKGLFARQAIPMVWDYAEVNPLCSIGGSFSASVTIVADALCASAITSRGAEVTQADAAHPKLGAKALFSTDPPYYANVGYADLSDFFYSWLRDSIRPVFPELFATVTTPKAQELIATPYRHSGKVSAEAFFLSGMIEAMRCLAIQNHPVFPATIYYASRQAEAGRSENTAGTDWQLFLDAVIRAGLGISGTLPVRTERKGRSVGIGTNALASSIVLVCRPRNLAAPSTTRREFIAALESELPVALHQLQVGNIAPVDLAQASIGPGMAIFTRYSAVLKAGGENVTVREALALINQTLDEVLSQQEGDLDAGTRWALAWFEQNGFTEGAYGEAETLSKAKNVSIDALKSAGLLESRHGKVRLFTPQQLRMNGNPNTDGRATAWEVVNHLAAALAEGGERTAAEIAAKYGARIGAARDLAYRLYSIAERKKRSPDALPYNNLVQSWPEIARLAKEAGERQATLPGIAEPVGA